MTIRTTKALALVGCVAVAIQANCARADCTTQQQDGFMNSWAGQQGTTDHSESRSVTKGTHFGCLAEATGSSPPPACILAFEHNGTYTLPQRNAMRAPEDDSVTLSCLGKAPTCCKVQVTPDPKPLPKPAAVTQVESSRLKLTAGVQTIVSTTSANGNTNPGRAPIKGPSSVTCVSAVGNTQQGYKASCNIDAPGHFGPVDVNQTIGTSGAGTVTLTCNGQAPLRCVATIH